MDKSDYQRLLHIKIHCEDIEECINRFGNNQQTFINDRAYFNAVAMSILQIGEIANSLSEEFKIETANEIPWQMIRGMRNIIAHLMVKLMKNMLWDTVNNDIPIMHEFCTKYLSLY